MSIPKTPLLLVGIFAVLMTGCSKTDTPSPTTMSSPKTSDSVALPPSQVPQSDASIPAQSPPATHANGDANAPAQNNPKQLGKTEESTAMPLSGQANNHSTATPEDHKKN